LECLRRLIEEPSTPAAPCVTTGGRYQPQWRIRRLRIVGHDPGFMFSPGQFAGRVTFSA
jgi:hypothetical protein